MTGTQKFFLWITAVVMVFVGLIFVILPSIKLVGPELLAKSGSAYDEMLVAIRAYQNSIGPRPVVETSQPPITLAPDYLSHSAEWAKAENNEPIIIYKVKYPEEFVPWFGPRSRGEKWASANHNVVSVNPNNGDLFPLNLGYAAVCHGEKCWRIQVVEKPK